MSPITFFPLPTDVETKAVLKKLPVAHAALAELKGIASSIPNQAILVNTLALQEAKDSSAIENIITTHDDLYKTELALSHYQSAMNAKEVQSYVRALKLGFDDVKKNGLITNKTILKVQEVLEGNQAGFRRVPGTSLKNALTGEVVYTPPQDAEEIVRLMDNLVWYINDLEACQYDPLVKMALIHHQFESIHPFYDGNGRTGRIINIIYLIMQELLDQPILYLSSYIIRNKPKYYYLLQHVRDQDLWEEWLLFMIEGVEQTARETIELVKAVKQLMQQYKKALKEERFYSQDLLNNLFKHPYTKIEFVVQDLGITRITAANYLNRLADKGLLVKAKLGISNYYINKPLFDLLSQR
jgi:Fic family protein